MTTPLQALVERVKAVVALAEKATPGPWLESPQGYPGISAKRRGRNETAPVFKEEGYHDERAQNIAATLALRNATADIAALADVVERYEKALRDVAAYDDLGFPHGTCAKIAVNALDHPQ